MSQGLLSSSSVRRKAENSLTHIFLVHIHSDFISLRWNKCISMHYIHHTLYSQHYWGVATTLLSTTKKCFFKINLHDSELMTYIHVLGRQLPKLLLHISMTVWNSNGIWNIRKLDQTWDQFGFLEFIKSSLSLQN